MSVERVLYYFDEICKIPRPSYEEGKIADYLEQQGQKMGLEVHRDLQNNVIIKKQGTRPDSPCIILQAHTDMVWETEDKEWSGEKIPKDIYISKGKMKTRGTTLGADDGIGIALILALLEEKEEKFPAIEAVFTANEEETMGGAMALKAEDLSGTYMINLDSEEEGVFTIGAAGGISAACTIPLRKNKSHFKSGLSISIMGGKGGHSGLEIHRKRENAIQLLVRLLQHFPKDAYELTHIKGGSRSNAIPDSAQVKLNTDNVESLQKTARDFFEKCCFEWREEEPDLRLQIEEEPAQAAYDAQKIEKVLILLENLPHGVHSRTEEFVCSSVNMALLYETSEGIYVELSLRSSYESWYKDEVEKIKRLVQVLGGSSEEKDEYPAWLYKQDSQLLQVFQKSYRELFGKEPVCENVHAGVECGIIMKNCPSICDAISIGPTIRNAHTIEEELEVESVDRIYQLLRKAFVQINTEEGGSMR